MYQALPLVEKGSKVTVDLDMVLDRMPTSLLKVLSADPGGTVVDYKMTDGRGIGLVLKMSDGSINWFFSEELETFEGQSLPLLLKDQSYKKGGSGSLLVGASVKVKTPIQVYEGSILVANGIMDLINPVNFFKWLIYSLKDIY